MKSTGPKEKTPGRRSKPTMSDVAREAGVSLGTVSNVVNGLKVNEAYRLKVEEAIRKLDYQVNNSGRNLKTGHSYTIALIIPNTRTPHFAALANDINVALVRRGYHMLLSFSDYDYKQEEEMLRFVRQNNVDGIIALTYNPRLELPVDIPCVTIDRFFSAQVPCVTADNYNGGRIAAEKFAELGCRKLAFLRIGSVLTNEPNKRKDGFAAACLEYGVDFDVKLLTDGEPMSRFEDFLREHLHDGRLDFDGIFCATDNLAYRVIRMLSGMGIKVPEDVQVIGFDGIRMFGDLNYICSTIVQPVTDIAETCVEMILSKDLAARPSLVCLPVRYAAGGTTKEPEEIPEEFRGDIK